jgi:hypothetical protein
MTSEYPVIRLTNKNNNNNMRMFIGLKRTTRETWTPQEKNGAGRITSYVLKQMYFNVYDEICNSFEIFWI